MARPRDYAAEYARRIARGQARGLSRSQARGHPRVREPLASQGGQALPPVPYNPRLEDGLRLMLRRKDPLALNQAARAVHVAPERLRNYFAESEWAYKERGRWRFRQADIVRQLGFPSEGRWVRVRVRGSDQASLWGRYMNAVKAAIRHQDPTALDPFRNDVLIDVRKRKHRLETRLDVLYRLHATDPSFEQIYRIVL